MLISLTTAKCSHFSLLHKTALEKLKGKKEKLEKIFAAYIIMYYKMENHTSLHSSVSDQLVLGQVENSGQEKILNNLQNKKYIKQYA